jgi:hypothetical protein
MHSTSFHGYIFFSFFQPTCTLQPGISQSIQMNLRLKHSKNSGLFCDLIQALSVMHLQMDLAAVHFLRDWHQRNVRLVFLGLR